MADHIIIEGVRPFDGAYELDLENQPFTALEWQWLNKIAGYLPMTIEDGFQGGDPMLFVTLAVIGLHRAGKITRDQAFEAGRQLADVPFDGTRIRYEGEAVEDPPAETPEPAGDSENKNSSNEDSGADSTTPSDRSGNGQSPTGDPPALTESTLPRLPV